MGPAATAACSALGAVSTQDAHSAPARHEAGSRLLARLSFLTLREGRQLNFSLSRSSGEPGYEGEFCGSAPSDSQGDLRNFLVTKKMRLEVGKQQGGASVGQS